MSVLLKLLFLLIPLSFQTCLILSAMQHLVTEYTGCVPICASATAADQASGLLCPMGVKTQSRLTLRAVRSQPCTVCAILCSLWLLVPTVFNDMCEVWDWGLRTSNDSDCVYREEHPTFTGVLLKRSTV